MNQTNYLAAESVPELSNGWLKLINFYGFPIILLIFLFVGFWKLFMWAGSKLAPKIEHFLEAQTEAMQKLPDSVNALERDFREIGIGNQKLLEMLITNHDSISKDLIQVKHALVELSKIAEDSSDERKIRDHITRAIQILDNR